MTRKIALLLFLGMGASGCSVVVYQPLRGLQDPVLADLRLSHLEGTRLLLDCVADTPADGRRLCERLEAVFTSQGATVRQAFDQTRADDASATFDLRLDIVSRQTDEQGATGWAALAYATGNVLPIARESVFTHDVTVRDAQGFLLAARRLDGRLIEHFGVAYWLLTWLLDLAVRDAGERLAGDAVNHDISRDLYGQLCQVAISARVRQRAFVQAAAGR
ncbi:MAG TPA: hypothetical protein VJQ51_10955 [Burkholderiales bacterium]|nr:hypothetical protein [Burkholderiales bacterium]